MIKTGEELVRNIGPGFLMAGALVLAMGLSNSAQSAAGNNDPLEGVWLVTSRTTADGESVNPGGAGQFIFMDGRYSDVHTTGPGDRPRPATSWQATDAEKVAQYDTIIVNSGTYEINGSEVTVRPIIAKSPEFVGGSSTSTFSINGDNLTLVGQGIVSVDGVRIGGGGSITMRRAP